MKNLRWVGIILLAVLLFAMFSMAIAMAGGDEAEKFSYGFWSIIPPVVAIGLAFATHRPILSLFIGIWTGQYIYEALPLFAKGETGKALYAFFTSFFHVFSDRIVGVLADSWYIGIITFTLMIGGLLGIINRSGGMWAIAEALARKAKNSATAQVFAAIMGVAIFFDDYANTLLVGNTMRPITDKFRVSREKLAYIVDSTAAPVASLALISTWIAYEVGIIADALKQEGFGEKIANAAYTVFLQSIPYRFYSLLALVLLFTIAITSRDYATMYKAEMRARKEGKVYRDGAQLPISKEISELSKPEGVPLRSINAWLPILVLIVGTIWALWVTAGGMETYKGYLDQFHSSFKALTYTFGDADASIALVWAVAAATAVAAIMVIWQKIMNAGEIVDAWLDGTKSMMVAVVILTIAWALGSINGDLGTSQYVVGLVEGWLPGSVLPLGIFLSAALISFATGTSWGTMAILMPIAIGLAGKFYGTDAVGVMHLATIGAVLTGAVFGDHCSPVSDTTILSSMASACDHMDHVTTQIPYSLTAATVAAVVGFLFVKFIPVWLLLLIGAAVIIAIVYIFGKPVPNLTVDELEKLDK
ncbi:Na+/H+ antiporter NhaC family protein [bacterium 3DAC]|nr:Na+/H+ antiporter NhaC family protein [Dictyoglomota bacterium]UZN22365.1 Na+/H+ antiporter NhaC family protein [bacterium 3DAC]